jgi:hypothetical protein
MELRNRLRAELGCELPSTAAFDYPCPEALTDFLLARVAPQPLDASAEPGSGHDDLGRLTAAELDRLIDELEGTAR